MKQQIDYKYILNKAQLNDSSNMELHDGETKVNLMHYLLDNKEDFPGIDVKTIEENKIEAYIGRKFLPLDLQEIAFSDTKEINDQPYINLIEAIRIAQESGQTIDLNLAGVESVERDVADKNYVVVGNRLTREDAIDIIAGGDEKKYWAIVEKIGELYKSNEEADIIGHLCKVMPKDSKVKKEGEEFAIAKIGQTRYDEMDNFRKKIEEVYGELRNLNVDEITALAVNLELREEIFKALPTTAKLETKKVYGDIFTSQIKAQVQYGSKKVADSVKAKAIEKAGLVQELTDMPGETEEEITKRNKRLAELMDEVTSLETQKNQIEKGKMYTSIDGKISAASIAQEEGMTIDDVETKPENDNIEEIVNSDEITDARRMIGKTKTTALAKIGNGYGGVVTTEGGRKMPVKYTPRDSKLGDSSKKVVDLLFEKIANLTGYTLRENPEFKKPTHDNEVVIGAVSMQILADAGEIYNDNNLTEMVNYINTGIKEELRKECKSADDIGNVLEKVTSLSNEAILRQNKSRAELSKDISVDEIEAQEMAYETEIKEEADDLARFGAAAYILKKKKSQTMAKLKKISKKNKT